MDIKKTKSTKGVVTRIAPSPTGGLHVGTARTALFNYLLAKQTKGKLILRLEDTDRERSDVIYEKEIFDALAWLGIKPDDIVRQSERRDHYRIYIKKLIDTGHAYISKEPSKKEEGKEVAVVRFKNPRKPVSFVDTVRGTITVDVTDLGDFVIARSVDEPLYNLAAVIDDISMGVTHILRGDDHIINTPRQVLLTEALQADLPSYTHISLVHGAEGGKLSKRKKSASITTFRDAGYLPDALINTIALLGWSPGSDREMFTPDELVQCFSLDGIQKKEAIFSEKKLQWFQKQHMKEASRTTILHGIGSSIRHRFPLRSRLNHRAVNALVQLTREQGNPFKEMSDSIDSGEYDFFFMSPHYEAALLIPKKERDEPDIQNHVYKSLVKTRELLETVPAGKGWSEAIVREGISSHAEDSGRARVFWPMRVALSGKEKSPDPCSIAQIIGKGKTIARLDQAIHLLKNVTA